MTQKGKIRKLKNHPGPLDRSLEEVELEKFRSTTVESPVNSFAFLQSIQTTLRDFSILKERVKGVGTTNLPQVSVVFTHTTSTQKGPIQVDIVDTRKINTLLSKSTNTIVSQIDSASIFLRELQRIPPSNYNLEGISLHLLRRNTSDPLCLEDLQEP